MRHFYPKNSILCISIIFLLRSVSVFGQWQPTTGPTGGNASCFLSVNQYVFAGKASASTFNGIARTDDQGLSWTNVTANGPNQNITNMAKIGTSIFALQANEVFISQDFGVFWSNVSSGLSAQPLKGIATRNNDIFVGSNRIYKSSNLGLSWQLLSNSPIGSVNDIVVQGDTILAALFNGQVHRSLDYGQTWTNISSGLPNASINSLILRGQTILAGTSVGIYKSGNFGSSWTAISSPISNVGDLALKGGVLFASGIGGFCVSYNNGQNWFSLNDGLTFPSSVGAIGFDQTFVYVGNGNTVVHRRPFNEFIVSNPDTCTIAVYDTTTIIINDTVVTNVFDTTFVNVYDTLVTNVIDTTFLTVTDTIYATVYDTLYTTVFDTVSITVVDTIFTTVTDTIFYSVSDTLIVQFLVTGPGGAGQETIKIYPNPTANFLIVENLNYSSYQNYTIEIKNSLGQSIFSSPFNQSSFILNLSQWTGPGIYYLRIYDPAGTAISVRKILLQ